MSELYSTTLAPPQSYLAVEAIHALLAGSANIVATNWIDATTDIYKYQHDEGFSGRILVVREQQQLGGKIAGLTKRENVGVQVMAQIRATLANGQKDDLTHRWLYSIHKRIEDVLVGQTLSLDPSDNLPGTHTVALPVMLDQYNSVPTYDADDDVWYSTAMYQVTLKAVTA